MANVFSPLRVSTFGFCYFSAVLMGVVLVTSCASRPPASTPRLTIPAEPQPYMRVERPAPDTTELHIAVRHFVPARGKGPKIQLIGVSHVGETNYYAALQARLDASTLVLYEGVDDARPRGRAQPRRGPLQRLPAEAFAHASGDASHLQGNMARSLGLAFQLDSVQYDRAHFRNSDLSVTQIQNLMQNRPAGPRVRAPSVRANPPAERPTPSLPLSESAEGDNAAFTQLLDTMQGNSTFGLVVNGLLQLIGSSTKMQAMARMTLIEMFGEIRGDLGKLRGLPPDFQRLLDVLVIERNKAVLDDLKEEIQSARRTDTIAIFYGAAHLMDLERRLRTELKYWPIAEEWLPAITVNTTRAGLSNFEIALIKSLLQTQMESLTPGR